MASATVKPTMLPGPSDLSFLMRLLVSFLHLSRDTDSLAYVKSAKEVTQSSLLVEPPDVSHVAVALFHLSMTEHLLKYLHLGSALLSLFAPP